jgi:hypothetical protein
MTGILQSIASIYRKSSSGRSGSLRDYTIDYEKFLRTANIADGDEREIAERELHEAELKSNGLLSVDRHPRSGMPERLRLRVGGEVWLYQQIGQAAPTAERSELAKAFREMAERAVPDQWQQTWTGWFSQLSQAAFNGGSVQPFRWDDSAGNKVLVNALIGILNWQGPSLIRYASTAICGDSKQLQKLEPRLRPALQAITGSDALEDFGILRKPRFVTFHGALAIRTADRSTDFSMFAGPVALSETNFPEDCQITTLATLCLTVENEDTFHELAATNPGVLLILTSYAGSAVRRLLNLLPDDLRFLHFGDGDPAGSDILRDLRQKSGRDIQPLLIPGQASQKRRPLRQTELSTIKRLLDSDLPASLLADMEMLLDNGVPVDFEQEGVPIQRVWDLVAEDWQAEK